MKDNHPYLVNIDLMIQVQMPEIIDPLTDDVMPYIRAAIGERIANNKAFEWLMENIGEIRPDRQPQQDTPEEIATEREAYREGQIAWVSHEAGNPVANTYPKGSPQHTAWNRGFNVGA